MFLILKRPTASSWGIGGCFFLPLRCLLRYHAAGIADVHWLLSQLEQQIVSSIENLQKVIEPVQSMYNAVAFGSSLREEDKTSVQKMQSELAALQKKVLVQNQQNQNLLKLHMEQIKKQIAEVHRANPYLGKRSVYAGANSAGGSFIAEAWNCFFLQKIIARIRKAAQAVAKTAGFWLLFLQCRRKPEPCKAGETVNVLQKFDLNSI